MKMHININNIFKLFNQVRNNKSHLILYPIFKFFYTLFLFVLILSCASVPKQIYLSKNEISKLNKVAVNVSSTELDIKYARETAIFIHETPTIVRLLLPLSTIVLGSVIESSIEYDEDKEKTQEFRKSQNKYYFEMVLNDHFLEQLNNTKFYKYIVYSKNTNHKELLDIGYDILIHLKVKDLCLQRIAGNKMQVYTCILGEMFDLEKDEVIWKREDVQISKEAYTLEEYKADEGKVLKDIIDKLFKKISFRMTIDIVYNE